MSLNDFELGKILGKGSFAQVLLVTRKLDRKIYAMKRINIAKMDPKEREGALNEIRILASLSHPNIIGYKEAFFDEGSKTLNIVMEYADDGDIDKKIRENLKKRYLFSEETIWTWIIQILKGLKYLHDNKIMHRDLKCANLFLMKSGILKLGDLNVSKIAKLGIAQTQTGTPYYISPEIWNEQPYDYKCDIWSVGCIIYEMCTLRPPFRGTSLNELYKNIKNGYYIPISNNYSNDIRDLVSMMIVVDYKKRASADELLNSNIIKKWIKKLKYENFNSQLTEEIDNNFSNNSKANLIKTIKIPKNLGEINRYLPKNRYNPSEEMMKNDKYEIMKETMKKGNNNVNNKKITNIGKYNYLNKYDNNMRLIRKENENNYYKNDNYNAKRNNYNYNNNDFRNDNKYNKYDFINRDLNKFNNKNDDNYNDNNLRNNNRNYNNYYRNDYQNINNNYEDNRNRNNYIYNYRKNYEKNNFSNNQYENNYNYNRYNNNYIENLYKNEEKNLTPNKYRHQKDERDYNNQYNNYNNRTPNKINDNNNEYNNYNNYNYQKEKYYYNQYNHYKQPINNDNNNFNKRKKNRYKYIFAEEGEENNDDNNKDNDYYIKRDNYPQNNYNYNYNQNNQRNKFCRNDYNDKRDIGPRYNLYDFRYNNYNNYNNNNRRENDEIKIIYQKINYNNYCQQNNFDPKRNYHYYRENGYYNYNQAMENYNRYNEENNFNNNERYRKYY